MAIRTTTLHNITIYDERGSQSSARTPPPGTQLRPQEAPMEATWQPPDGGHLSKSELPDSAFAFPAQRKEPLLDAAHVRNAVARFNQVQGVSDADRDLAWANILAAAEYFGVHVSEKSWHELL